MAGQSTIIEPDTNTRKHKQKLLTDSTIDWLAQAGLRLCQKGSTSTTESLSYPIKCLSNVPADILLHCHNNGLYFLADLVSNNPRTQQRQWLRGSPYDQLHVHLPTTVPTETNPLHIGQYWKLQTHTTDELRAGNIVRIDGNTDTGIAVTKWTIPDSTKPSGAYATHRQYIVPHAILFPTLQPQAIRVTLIKKSYTTYKCYDQRLQDTPQWPSVEAPSQPQ